MRTDARLDAVIRHPGYAAAVAQRPSRDHEWGWMIVVVLLFTLGVTLLVAPFLRLDRLGAGPAMVFILLGVAALWVGVRGWRVQRHRLGPVAAAPAIIVDLRPIVIHGRYPRTEQHVGLRYRDGTRWLRDRDNRPLGLGAAGVAHTAADILLAFTPLEP